MADKIFETDFEHVVNISEEARIDVISQVSKKPKEFKENWKGFVRINTIISSPPRTEIEPVKGASIPECFKNQEKEIGITGDVF